jgi:hypothetical protein
VFGVIVLTLLILLALTAIGTILVFAWIDDTAAIYIRDVGAASFFAPFAALACTLTYHRLRELQPASFRSRTRGYDVGVRRARALLGLALLLAAPRPRRPEGSRRGRGARILRDGKPLTVPVELGDRAA